MSGSEQKIRLVIEALSKTDAAFSELKRHLRDAQGETDALTAKTRSLDGGLGRLAARYLSLTAVIGGVTLAAKQAISYLSRIETATLGIGAAFMVGGKYIDATSGKALAAQDALKAATGDAKEIIGELQYANLQTIATLDELINAYQVTLPVALAKGFNRQQVKDFTVAMVQAAGAIGLQMNQLAEETRSLLTGAIDPRTSRIATVLGLRNEDIQQYRGNAEGLFNFLMDKLAAYRTAGVESQKTWAGLWSNAKDIVLQALGKAFEPLFETFKSELKNLADRIVTIDDTTKRIKWNPEFIEGIKSIRSTVEGVIAELYRMGMLLDRIGGTISILKLDPKMNDLFRARYMESEKALQDMAMRSAGGWKPVTPDIDKQMREAAAKGKRLFEQITVNVGNPEEATQQLLRYYREIGGNKKTASWKGNAPAPDKEEEEKARKAAEKAQKEKERLDDLWIASEGRKLEEADAINEKYFKDIADARAKAEEEGTRREMELFAQREAENAQYLAEMPARLRAEREAEIQSQLVELDLQEKLGRAHGDTLIERIRLLKELRKSQEQGLAAIDKDVDPTGWYAQLNAIRETQQAVVDLNGEIARQDPLQAIGLGLQDVANRAKDTGKQLYDAVSGAFDGMTDALVDFVMTGKGSFTDLANSIIRDMIRIQMQQQVTGPLASGLGKLIGGLFSTYYDPALGTTVSGTQAPYHHAGGMGNEPTFFRIIPNLDGLPRYHRGLGPGERIAVTTDDESTMTPGQRRDFFRLAAQYGARDAAVAQAPDEVHVHLTVNALDSRSVSQQLAQHREEIVALVNMAYNRRGQRGPMGV